MEKGWEEQKGSGQLHDGAALASTLGGPLAIALQTPDREPLFWLVGKRGNAFPPQQWNVAGKTTISLPQNATWRKSSKSLPSTKYPLEGCALKTDGLNTAPGRARILVLLWHVGVGWGEELASKFRSTCCTWCQKHTHCALKYFFLPFLVLQIIC